jgi:hypothetical protein
MARPSSIVFGGTTFPLNSSISKWLHRGSVLARGPSAEGSNYIVQLYRPGVEVENGTYPKLS